MGGRFKPETNKDIMIYICTAWRRFEWRKRIMYIRIPGKQIRLETTT
jgi:hypothetical protein